MTGGIGINPWFNMWVHPRKTIRRIVAIKPNVGFVWLSAIYGFPLMMQISQALSLSLFLSWELIVLGSIILAPFVGMVGILIASALFTWIGRWLGGNATFEQVKAAVTWSNVPLIMTSLSWIACLVVFRGMLFYEGFFQSAFIGSELTLISVVGGVQSAIAIWSLVLLVAGLAEVQEFSAWKALVNIILPFILLTVALWALMWVVWWFRGLV
jgi:hypothetical protein